MMMLNVVEETDCLLMVHNQNSMGLLQKGKMCCISVCGQYDVLQSIVHHRSQLLPWQMSTQRLRGCFHEHVQEQF